MASNISIAHAIEALNWFEATYGRDNIVLCNAFMRGLDEGYNIQESWYNDPHRTGRSDIPLLQEDPSPRGHGLRIGSIAAVFTKRGHREQMILYDAPVSQRS